MAYGVHLDGQATTDGNPAVTGILFDFFFLEEFCRKHQYHHDHDRSSRMLAFIPTRGIDTLLTCKSVIGASGDGSGGMACKKHAQTRAKVAKPASPVADLSGRVGGRTAGASLSGMG